MMTPPRVTVCVDIDRLTAICTFVAFARQNGVITEPVYLKLRHEIERTKDRYVEKTKSIVQNDFIARSLLNDWLAKRWGS